MVEAGYRICACPACGSRFRVTEAQLGAAGGQVRCGACLALFDARATLAATAAKPPAEPVAATPSNAEPPSAAPLSAPVPAPPAESVPAVQSVPPVGPQPSPTPPPSRTAHAATSAAHHEEAAPGVAAPRAPAARQRYRRPPVAARLVLALLFGVGLAANVLALMADQWALQPELRPRYQQACALLSAVLGPAAACQLPRALASIDLSEPLAIERGHPPATLLLAGQVVNQAAFPQPPPALLLRLKDASDATIAEHRLVPRDYLPAPGPLLPKQAAALAIRVPDPGPEAVRATLTWL